MEISGLKKIKNKMKKNGGELWFNGSNMNMGTA